ncbi:hypothetical protein M407DRAFT_17385 [Tulasnella calospora MUT 4182]|uniref:ribonuclease Z n=1 Tax=Tulasnella calospora MUT 4182 TaxID=1051891 RepID=A0A0C3QVT0_9AGAM|nr:hypothetical protein M407DRAFT_17385 [Tulasnella calospora MUT 4182]
MQWSLRVITGLTADTEPSLILKFESPPAKYIFNVPEGTNRACIQKRYGIAKTKAAFLTRLHPEQIGGFPGLVMMLADINSRDLAVCGPAGLTHYVASTRFYARRTAFGVNVNEYKHHDMPPAGNATPATLPPPIFKDENIVVHSIALYPSAVDDDGSTGSPSGSSKRKRSSSATPPPSAKRRSTEASPVPTQFLEADVPLPSVPTGAPLDDAGRIHRERILHLMFRPPASNTGPAVATYDMDLDKAAESAPGSPSKASSSTFDQQFWSRRLPKFRETPQTLAYFVVGPATRGKFDAKRAKELGVVGPLCSKLTRGETVTTPSGNVVTPDMCVGPSIPPPAFLFLHVPDPTYIDSIFSSPEFFLPSTYGSTVQLHAIIHRVGPGVLEDKRYREWMASFEPAVNHMIASERYSPDQVTYSSSARMQLELSYLDNEIFRPPHHGETAPASLSSWPDLPPKTSILAQDTEISMHPRLDPAPTRFVPPDDFKATLEAIDSGSYVHPLENIYKTAREDAERSSSSHLPTHSNGEDVAITTLGTGSAMPSKYRNGKY